MFIGEGVVVISVLVYLGEERVQKVDVTRAVVVQCVSFVRWLVTKKKFRVNQIDNMTFPVLLHRCLLNLDTFEPCVWMIYDTFKSIIAELLQMS